MSQSGAHQSATCQKGVQSCRKGVLPYLVETAGYTLAKASQKGVLGHTPLLITLVYPLYTGEKKKRKEHSGCLGGAHGARQTLQIFIWSRFDGEHGRRRQRKALSPFLSRFSGGVYPFLSNALIIINGTGSFFFFVGLLCFFSTRFIDGTPRPNDHSLFINDQTRPMRPLAHILFFRAGAPITSTSLAVFERTSVMRPS